MKTLEEFIEELNSSEELQKAVGEIRNTASLAVFLKDHGCDATAEDFEKFVCRSAEGELNDEDLDKVAGGCMIRLPYIGRDGKAVGTPGVDYGFIDTPTIVKQETIAPKITVDTGDAGDEDVLILW